MERSRASIARVVLVRGKRAVRESEALNLCLPKNDSNPTRKGVYRQPGSILDRISGDHSAPRESKQPPTQSGLL